MIPRPRVVRPGGPGATLADGLAVVADDASAGVASLLVSELEAATGWRVRRDALGTSSPYGVVRLEVRPDAGAGTGGDRHRGDRHRGYWWRRRGRELPAAG